MFDKLKELLGGQQSQPAQRVPENNRADRAIFKNYGRAIFKDYGRNAPINSEVASFDQPFNVQDSTETYGNQFVAGRRALAPQQSMQSMQGYNRYMPNSNLVQGNNYNPQSDVEPLQVNQQPSGDSTDLLRRLLGR